MEGTRQRYRHNSMNKQTMYMYTEPIIHTHTIKQHLFTKLIMRLAVKKGSVNKILTGLVPDA